MERKFCRGGFFRSRLAWTGLKFPSIPWLAGVGCLGSTSKRQWLMHMSWIFIGRTDAEAETPILWPPDAKSWFIWKYPDAGKDWVQEEKGKTEDEMVGWHYQLNGHGFGCTPGVADGQGGLACCDSWGRKELDTTEWTELNWCTESLLSKEAPI